MLIDRIMMNESINEWMVEVVWMVIDGWGMMNESLKLKHIVGGCPWIIPKLKHICGLGALFSKMSLTLRKFKQIVEVPQVCLRNGALFFAFLEWL